MGEGGVALDIEDRYRESKKMEHCSYTMELESSKTLLIIFNQSYDTEVADGKSTFLLVQGSPRESASYQWKKDGQPISKNSSYWASEESPTLGCSIEISRDIGECGSTLYGVCGSTLYVGLSRIVRNLIQKSTV